MQFGVITVKDYCPYCGELIEILVDASVDNQDYIEDCEVCCRPIIIVTALDPENKKLNTQLKREDD